jgi:hypothetical protein
VEGEALGIKRQTERLGCYMKHVEVETPKEKDFYLECLGKGVLKRIFGLNRQEVTDGWTKLHSER